MVIRSACLCCCVGLTALTVAAQVVEPTRAATPPQATKSTAELRREADELLDRLDGLWPRLPADPRRAESINWPLARLKWRKADFLLRKDAAGYYRG